MFRVILAAILLCPFLVQWYQEKGCLEWKAPVAYVLAYSLLAMMSWNVIFTVSEPKYEQAILADKEKKVHWHGGRRSVNYYFTGETADGEQIWGSVAGIYEQAEVGDPIWICQYESLFGIEYFEFQIPK